MEGGAGAMLSGNLKMWGFLRWKPRFFEMDGEEIRLCTPPPPPLPRAFPSSSPRCSLRPLRSPLSAVRLC